MTATLCGVDTPWTELPPRPDPSTRSLCADWSTRWSIDGLPVDERSQVCPGAGVVDGLAVTCDHDCHRLPGRSRGTSIVVESQRPPQHVPPTVIAVTMQNAPTVRCTYCGQAGHLHTVCPVLAYDASQRRPGRG